MHDEGLSPRAEPFELNTVRPIDVDGAEGVGYIFTTGRNGAAEHASLNGEIAELFDGAEADEIERIWRKAWWALHYGGRAGPTVLAISAFDIMALYSGQIAALDVAPDELRQGGTKPVP